MRRLRVWFLRLAGLFNKERRDRELAEEIESHLAMHMEDNLRRGMTPEEARREALIKLGGMEQTKESYRERRGLPMLETLMQVLRFCARMFWKNPGFTAVAVITLAPRNTSSAPANLESGMRFIANRSRIAPRTADDARSSKPIRSMFPMGRSIVTERPRKSSRS